MMKTSVCKLIQPQLQIPCNQLSLVKSCGFLLWPLENTKIWLGHRCRDVK